LTAFGINSVNSCRYLPQRNNPSCNLRLHLKTLEEPLLRSLHRLLPSARVSISPADLTPTPGDTYPGYLYRQNGKYLPQAVVFPQSEQEIAALMLWASQREIHLLPWGGGTAPYYAKSQIEHPLLVVDLRYMRQIIKIDEARATAQVQGGAQWQEIEQSVEPLKLTTGQFFTSPNATVGGRIAANTAGIRSWDMGPFWIIRFNYVRSRLPARSRQENLSQGNRMPARSCSVTTV
jgi:hypothetical protein